MKITEEMIERGAREFVWQTYEGNVAWEDTDDSVTTGDPQTRMRAWHITASILHAAHKERN